MRGMRAPFVVLSLAGVFVISSAHAQPAASNAAAEQLFMEGRALMQEGKLEAACPKLAESHRLDPGVGTLLNLGECWEKSGKTASAWATYREAETLARRNAQKERAAHAAAKVAALEPSLAHLTITVDATHAAPGIVVRRDGESVAQPAWATRLPIDPGSHRVEASAPGYKTWSSTIDVHAKDDARIAVPALEREAAAPTTVPTTSTSSNATTTTHARENDGSTQRLVGWVVAGAGVVASGVGLGFGVMAQSKNDEARTDHCSAIDCTQRGADLISDAKEAATLSTALVISGLAIVAVGVVLVFTAPRGSSSPRASAPLLGVTF